LRVVAFAYHNVGLTALEALLATGNEIVHIFSHEDDPAEKIWFGSVVNWAREHSIGVSCPLTINTPETLSFVTDTKPDALFSFHYRYLIGEALLALPPLGAYNLHGSLLPQYRGRAPVNWVLINGETITGVTLHHMVPRVDAGDIVAQRPIPIANDDIAFTLYKKICHESHILLCEALPQIANGTAPRLKQDLALGSYYGKRTPADGRIDWGKSAKEIYNLIRAVTEPYPGAFCFLDNGERMNIWWAQVCDKPYYIDARAVVQGTGALIFDDVSVHVVTGEGALELLDVDVAGKRMEKKAIFNFFSHRKGMKLQ